MDASRSILGAAENSFEYALGVAAARDGVIPRTSPFKHGSKPAMRYAYGIADTRGYRRIDEARSQHWKH